MAKPVRKKDFGVKPSYLCACRKLAGNVTSGATLYEIYNLTRNKSLKDENGDGGYLAVTMEQLMHITGNTRSQHAEAMKNLQNKGLIKRRLRKMSRRDKHAKIWVAVTDEAKAEISQIIDSNIVYDNSELKRSIDSETAETMNDTNSGPSESLAKNVIKEKCKKDNVNIVTNNNNNLKYFSIKDLPKEKEEVKKEWYQDTILAIYIDNKAITPEPYKESSFKQLHDTVSYLESVKTIYQDDLSAEITSITDIIKSVINDWQTFIDFASSYKEAYNEPKKPALWFISVQRGAIPDFIRFKAFVSKIKKHNGGKYNNAVDDYLDDFTNYMNIKEKDKDSFWESLHNEHNKLAELIKKQKAMFKD